MSTKIYNGYSSPLSIEKLLPLFISERDNFKKITKSRFQQEFIKNAVEDFDIKHSDSLFATPDYSFSDFASHEYNIQAEEISKLKNYERGLSIPFSELGVYVCLFPLNTDNIATLILFYNEDREVIKHWESLSYINDYHYQNSTDRPDHISKKDWKKRIKNWDTVLGGNGWGRPIDYGYNFTFCEREIPYFSSHMLNDVPAEFFPSNEKRKLNLYIHKSWNEKRKSLKKENPEKNYFISEYFDFRKQAIAGYKSGINKEDVDSIILQPVSL